MRGLVRAFVTLHATLRATLHVALMTPAAAAEAVALRIMAVRGCVLLRLTAARDEGRQARYVAIRSAGLLRLTVVKARLVILPRLMIVAILSVVLTILAILPVVARLVVVMLLMAGLVVAALLIIALLVRLLMFARGMRLAAARLRLHHTFVVAVELIVGALLATAAGLRLLLLLIGLVLPELFLRRSDQTEIMLGVLVVVFRRDRIARGGRIAGQLNVFFGNMVGGTPDFDVGSVRFVNARKRIVILASAASAAPTITTPHAMVLVLTVPHSLPFRQPWLMTVFPPDVFTL